MNESYSQEMQDSIEPIIHKKEVILIGSDHRGFDLKLLIRKHLIKDKNYLDAVIGLPANIFYGTSIPTCILVLKKNRKHSDNILFIDASQNYGKATTQNYLRDDDLEAILDAFNVRGFNDKYSYVAPISEIESEHDFNLNIPRYVDTFEEEEMLSISDVASEIVKVETQINELDQEINKFCNELSIASPFGEK